MTNKHFFSLINFLHFSFLLETRLETHFYFLFFFYTNGNDKWSTFVGFILRDMNRIRLGIITNLLNMSYFVFVWTANCIMHKHIVPIAHILCTHIWPPQLSYEHIVFVFLLIKLKLSEHAMTNVCVHFVNGYTRQY